MTDKRYGLTRLCRSASVRLHTDEDVETVHVVCSESGAPAIEVKVDRETGRVHVVVHDVDQDIQVGSANAIHCKDMGEDHRYEPQFGRPIKLHTWNGVEVEVLAVSRRGRSTPRVVS